MFKKFVKDIAAANSMMELNVILFGEYGVNRMYEKGMLSFDERMILFDVVFKHVAYK